MLRKEAWTFLLKANLWIQIDFRHTTANSEDVAVASVDLRQLAPFMWNELAQHCVLHLKIGTNWGNDRPDTLVMAYDEANWRALCSNLAKNIYHDTCIELNIINGNASVHRDLLLPLAMVKRVIHVILHADRSHPLHDLLSKSMGAMLEDLKVNQETCLAFLEEGRYLQDVRGMTDAAAALYEQGWYLSRHFQRFVSLAGGPERAQEYNTLLRMELNLLLAAINAHLDFVSGLLKSDKAVAQRRLDHCRDLANWLFDLFSMTNDQRALCHSTRARVYEYYGILWEKSGIVSRKDWMRTAAEDYYWAALLKSDADPFADEDLQRVNAQRPAEERMTATNCVRPETVPTDDGGSWTGDPRLLKLWSNVTLMPGPPVDKFVTMSDEELQALAAKVGLERDIGAKGFLRLLGAMQ